MKFVFAFMVGVLLWILCSSCATPFPYKYYSIDGAEYKGTLRGPQSKDDLPYNLCEPSAFSKAPCIVMFTDDFLRLKQTVKESRCEN